MQTDYIKNQIIENFKSSFGIVASDKEWHVHPLRVVQATKSLIGTDLDNPSEKLLLWLQLYIEKNNFQEGPRFIKNVEFREVVSVKQLEESIINKNVVDSRESLANLIKVSDGRPILEYMLEMSLNQSGISFLMIRSIIRSNIFMESKNIEPLLYDCLNVLLDFEFLETDIVENSKFLSDHIYIEVLLSLIAMDKEEFIRKDRFSNTIDCAKNKLRDISDTIKSNSFPINLSLCGRKGLVDFLNNSDVSIINPETVLFFDSIRSVLFANDDCDQFRLTCIVNNYLKGLKC